MTESASASNTQNLADSGAVLCFINGNKAWGGGENWHLGAARYFAEQGCRAVLCGRPDGALHQAGLELLAQRPELGEYLRVIPWRFKNLDFLNQFKTRAFARLLKEQGISHVITGQTIDMKGAMVAALGLPVKVFYRRGLAFPVKGGMLNRAFYGALAGLIVNSQATGELVLKNAGIIKPDKVQVIYNAVDVDAFDAAMRADDSPTAGLWNGERPLVIGNAGRLSTQKGQIYLLHMSAELKRRGFAHRLAIAGDGELRHELETLAAKLGLSVGAGLESGADVIMPGFMVDMAPFWKSIDFFMLSSLWEGFGYVLAEAMLARKPVCAFNVNSMPEVVSEGENGFLLPAPRVGESAEDVGMRLAELVCQSAKEPQKLAAMGAQGRQICQRRFERRIVMDELAELLLRAC